MLDATPFTDETRIRRETTSLVDSSLFETVCIGAICEEGLPEQLDKLTIFLAQSVTFLAGQRFHRRVSRCPPGTDISGFREDAGMNTALHIYPSPFTHETRIRRETMSLVDSGLFEMIHIGAIWEEGLPEHEQLDKRRRVWRVRLTLRGLPGVFGKLLRFAEWYVRLLLGFRKEGPSFINCHSLSALPLGNLFRLFYGSRIIYDTHELETETTTARGFRKKLAKIVERALIRQVDAVIVVNDLIGDWYRRTYDLDEIHVVRNVPHKHDTISHRTTILRDCFRLRRDDLLFLYQGIMDEGRGIPIILAAFAELPPNRHVVFLGNGPLANLVETHESRHGNIHYHPAVPPHKLLEYTASADVGISLIENVCLSYYYSLPNKVFEYLMSGVPIIVSDFPEMGRVVDETGCGWKAAVDVRSFAGLVRALTNDEVSARHVAARHAAQRFNWRAEEAKLLALYKKLICNSPGTNAACL